MTAEKGPDPMTKPEISAERAREAVAALLVADTAECGEEIDDAEATLLTYIDQSEARVAELEADVEKLHAESREDLFKAEEQFDALRSRIAELEADRDSWRRISERLQGERNDAEAQLKTAREALDAAFILMNTYSKDPYNMGEDVRNHASISPHGVLAEVYAILAPAQIALAQLKETTDV